MDNSLYNRYAIAFLSLAKEENKVEEYRKEVKCLTEIFKNNPDFCDLFRSISIKKETKYNVIDKTFEEFSIYSRNLLKVIIKNNRSYYLYKILKETLFRFDDYLGVEEGRIISSKKLSKAELDKITKAIERNTNKRIELKEEIDESLIGGFMVILKNDIYDASVKRKISNLREQLLGGDN